MPSPKIVRDECFRALTELASVDEKDSKSGEWWLVMAEETGVSTLVEAAKRILESWPVELSTEGESMKERRGGHPLDTHEVSSSLEMLLLKSTGALDYVTNIMETTEGDDDGGHGCFAAVVVCGKRSKKEIEILARGDMARKVVHLATELDVASNQLHRSVKSFLMEKSDGIAQLRVVPAGPLKYPTKRPVPYVDSVTLALGRLSDLCYLNEEYVSKLTTDFGQEAVRAKKLVGVMSGPGATNRQILDDIRKKDEQSKGLTSKGNEGSSGDEQTGEIAPDDPVYYEFGRYRLAKDDERTSHLTIAPSLSRMCEFVGGKHDAQMYVFRFDGSLTFAFRGTEGGEDLLHDLTALPIRPTGFPDSARCENVKVHMGFNRQWAVLEPHVRAEMEMVVSILRKEKEAGKTRTRTNSITGEIEELVPEIICTGHSLGGGLATIAALYVKMWYGQQVRVRCETFGSPRVGGKAFVELFNTSVDISRRIINDLDPIPMVPPQRLGYYHVSGGVWITGGGKVHYNLASLGARRQQIFKKVKNMILHPKSIGDHAACMAGAHVIMSYVDAVEKIAMQPRKQHSSWKRLKAAKAVSRRLSDQNVRRDENTVQ